MKEIIVTDEAFLQEVCNAMMSSPLTISSITSDDIYFAGFNIASVDFSVKAYFCRKGGFLGSVTLVVPERLFEEAVKLMQENV